MSRRALAVMALILAACGQAAQPDETTEATVAVETTAADPSTTTASPEPTATTAADTTTTVAADAAPAELAGVWRTDRDDRLMLRLSGTSYTLSSAVGSSTGDISVEGDRITFSNCDCPDPACQDPGTYLWVIGEDSLTLTVADPADPCSGRRTRLAEVDYTR